MKEKTLEILQKILVLNLLVYIPNNHVYNYGTDARINPKRS